MWASGHLESAASHWLPPSLLKAKWLLAWMPKIGPLTLDVDFEISCSFYFDETPENPVFIYLFFTPPCRPPGDAVLVD